MFWEERQKQINDIIKQGDHGFEVCKGYNYYLKHFNYLRKKEIVEDSESLKWRVGDIIIFISGYHKEDDWRDWYLKEEDKHKYCSRNHSVPIYAGVKLAVITERYKWIKIKPMGKFRDYGKRVMMISGSKKGNLRKFMGATPFKLFSKFPHHNIESVDNQIIEVVKQITSDDEKSRNLFIKKLKDNL